MSSSSSASKLSGLAGLNTAKKAVLSMTGKDSPVHAVLLYGVEGTGKTELARILAQAWLCLKPGDEGACGECRACVSFERGNNPDLQWVEPQGASRWISVKAVNEYPKAKEKDEIPTVPISRFFNTLPISSRHKVVVISDADRLTHDASNALLKTLEEPPPHAKLILTTPAVGLILPTILSRCVALACELPDEVQLAQSLGSLSEAERLLSGSAPGIVKRIREKPEGYERLIAFAMSCRGRSSKEALAMAEEFKAISDSLGADEDSARAVNSEGLKMLATAWSRLAYPGEWVQAATEAHRRVQGNANVAFVLDALFAGLR